MVLCALSDCFSLNPDQDQRRSGKNYNPGQESGEIRHLRFEASFTQASSIRGCILDHPALPADLLMHFFKDKKHTSPSGISRNDHIRGDSDSRESSASRAKGNSGGSSGPAAVISVLITACLLIAGGVFVISGTRRAEDTRNKELVSSSEDLRTWLGLDPIQRILSPTPEDTPASTFSAETSQESFREASAEDVTADTASLNAGEGSATRNDAASGTDTSPETTPAEGTSRTASAAASLAAGKDSSAAASLTAGKDSSAAASAAASGGNAAEKKAADKAPDSKKVTEADKASGDKKETEADKDSNSKKETEADKKDKEEDEDNSLTKTQKKYVKSWEENHFRPFPLTTGLHDYNWKYLKYDDDGVLQYKGDENYTVRRGIDVSEFQGKIDWEKVKKEGYDFVFVRAGHRTFHTGSLEKDTRAIKNLTRAEEAGLDVGVYVFSQAVSIKEAIEEAELCLDVIEESGVEITLPVVFDPEIQIEYDARINYISSKQFTDNAVAFCETIKEAGFTPAIYANCSTETDILNLSRLENAEIWYADYNSVPESPYRFTYWQYTNMGWVDGIPETETDLNLWFVPKDSSKKDSTKKSTADKDSSKKDSAEKVNATKDSSKKDSADKGSTKKDSTEKDSTDKDNTKKDSAVQDSAARDSSKKDNADKGSTKKDSADKGDAKKNSTGKDGTDQSSTKKDDAKKDGENQNSAKKDGAEKNETDQSSTNSTKKNASDKKDSEKNADKNANKE